MPVVLSREVRTKNMKLKKGAREEGDDFHWHETGLSLVCTVIALLLCSALTRVGCFSFSFERFKSEGHFILHNSNIALGVLQVTPDTRGSSIANYSGRALYEKQFTLWSKIKGRENPRLASFNSTFVLNISPRTKRHRGEGMAFILTANSTLPKNSQGKWLGIVNANTNGTAEAGIVAVEFDTRESYPEDVDGNHVGLDINSIYSIKQESLASHDISLSSGDNVMVLVQYDGYNLSVFMGKNMKNPVFTQPIDLSNYLPEKIFVGFSASTSDYTELHRVNSWEFSGLDVEAGGSRLLWVEIAVPGTAALLISIGFYVCWRWKSKKDQIDDSFSTIEEEIKGSSMAPQKFRLEELKRATGRFDSQNMLGRGGFGTVYKGILRSGEVAVKRFSKQSSQGRQEFIAEVTTIGNLHHKNLVKLVGWCYENDEFLLVYEYMPNGSLDKFIFSGEQTMEEEPVLSWGRRLSIICGVAHALDYLHNGCEKRVLHRDIKASNIMLDSEFNAKLGDFGLARTITRSEQTHHSTREVAGTPGYMAPETFLTGHATTETDVYAFGVLVMEIVCGRKPGNQNEQNEYNNGIVCWLWEQHKMGSLVDAVDHRLNGKFVKEEVESILVMGLSCCHPNPHHRPSMKTVLQILTGETAPPGLPTERPAFVWPARPPSSNESDFSLVGSQLDTFSRISAR